MWPFTKKLEFAAAKPTAPQTLYRTETVLNPFQALLRQTDTDDVLRKLGMRRHRLREMEFDDEIYAALETRREALIATAWRLEPGKGRAVTFLWNEIDAVMPALMRAAFAAVPYGYSVAQITYARRDDGRIGVAGVVEEPLEFYEPKPNGELWRFSYDDPAGAPVDARFKYLLTLRHAGARQPYGEALLSRLYWPWYFRREGWRFWAKSLERAGIPFIKGTAPDRVAPDGRQCAELLSESLTLAVQNATLALPDGWTAEFMSAQQNGATFEQFEQALIKRIQRVILGQTLTSDVGKTGSFAAAQVHNEVRDDRRRADIRLVSATAQKLLDALHELNGFTGDPPRFVMEDGAGLELERAERDAKLTQAGILALTPEYLLRVYDFEEGDFTAPANNAAAIAQPTGKSFALFSADAPTPRFTPEQQAVEELANDMLATMSSPVSSELIASAIRAAKDPDDLEARLATLMGEDTAEFQTALERALFAADVMGYAHAG